MKFRLLLSLSFLATTILAQTVTLKQLGKSNNYISINTAFTAHFGGALYSLDRSGSISKTDLLTGEYTTVGKATFSNCKLFFAVNRKLFVIDNDGSMTQIDPASGAWSSVSNMSYWTLVTNVIVVSNTMFAIENGVMYRYFGFNNATRRQVGDADFYSPGLLITDDSTMYSISDDKSFYEINTSTGKWTKVGKSKTWKSSWSGAVLHSKLYTVENPGILFESPIADGVKKQLDDTQFKKGRFLFTDSQKIYMITSDGNLFEISIN